MADRALPAIGEVPALTTEERGRILDLLFEPCAQLHALSLEHIRDRRFASYDDLIQQVREQLVELAASSSATDMVTLYSILSAHPRLGEKRVNSTQSRSEQAHLKSGGEQEAQELAALNARYEEAFPGLRYVVFVNGRLRPLIMENMRSRIARNDVDLELAEAIEAICEIASDRAAKCPHA